MHEMKRKDREINDLSIIKELIDTNTVMRVAFSDENIPYIIPMNYGYKFEGEKLTFYFHSAKEGQKFNIMEKNNIVCFEIDCDHRLVEGKTACQYTFEFSSVVGVGKSYIVDTFEEKNEAMKNIMMHISKKDFDFSEKLLNVIKIWKIEVDEFKGKRRMMPKI